MAFCTKCGKELAENEVCSCQQEAPVEAPQAEAPQAPVEQAPVAQEAPAAEKNNNKYFKYAAIAVVVLGIIIVIASLAGGKPYKKMLNEYVSLVNKKSNDVYAYNYALMADGRVKLAKDVQKASLKSEDAKDELEELKEKKADQFEDCNDEYEKWKLSYEIKSAKKMDEKDLKDYQKATKGYYKSFMKESVKALEEILEDEDDEIEDGADNLDISKKEYKKLIKAKLKQYKDLEDIEISAGYEVKVKFFVKTKDDEYKTEMVKVAVLKVNGDWVYAGPAIDEVESFYFEDASDLKFLVSPLNSSYIYR